MNSSSDISLIASEWIIIEMRSGDGGAASLRSHKARNSVAIWYRWVSRSIRVSGLRASSMSPAQSDQVVSLRRSSHGKSNSIASIPVVSSIDTRSTQSNVPPSGSSSRTSPVRRRISTDMRFISAGVKTGATVRRCSVCLGRSMAMNIGSMGSGTSGSRSATVMPPYSKEEEKTSGSDSTYWIALVVTTFQCGPNGDSATQLTGPRARNSAKGSCQRSSA